MIYLDVLGCQHRRLRSEVKFSLEKSNWRPLYEPNAVIYQAKPLTR